MPIVSVIIPTYNTRQQLLDMVECMRAQTLQNWELIIVDDKSMDGSLEYIKSVITDERIKIVVRDREPKGSVVCRNIGFELASGKYVIHFDADDLISQKCLEDRTKYMEDHEDIDFAIFRG
ncbi:glycosyltransferase family 2 protein, partial [Bacteroides cellulosilyticus]